MKSSMITPDRETSKMKRFADRLNSKNVHISSMIRRSSTKSSIRIPPMSYQSFQRLRNAQIAYLGDVESLSASTLLKTSRSKSMPPCTIQATSSPRNLRTPSALVAKRRRFMHASKINPIDRPIPVKDRTNPTTINSKVSNGSLKEQVKKLKALMIHFSIEPRLWNSILIFYVSLMFGLLFILILLIRAYSGSSPIIYQEVMLTSTKLIRGDARHGQFCSTDQSCHFPLICRKQASSLARCVCPSDYEFIDKQCVGQLNSICEKDKDCQRSMLCTGMSDGKRRCQCQTLFHYDRDKKKCIGQYHASCLNDDDCQHNLRCERTTFYSWCSCDLYYRYDPLEHKCRGDPGARCNASNDFCTDNAQCRDGICQCSNQFIPDRFQRCMDPCPDLRASPTRIRYPGNCRRFIDCQRRVKSECPDGTIFNFRTQLCDYPQNVFDCR